MCSSLAGEFSVLKITLLNTKPILITCSQNRKTIGKLVNEFVINNSNVTSALLIKLESDIIETIRNNVLQKTGPSTADTKNEVMLLRRFKCTRHNVMVFFFMLV